MKIQKATEKKIGLSYKSDNTINLKSIKYIVKRYCLIINKVV